MRIDQTGITRIVLVFSKIVIKIPRFNYGWETFLRGILANIDENQVWKWNSGKYFSERSKLLCPVLWCSWGGWFLIMPKVDVKRHEEEMKKLEANKDVYQVKWFREEYYRNWFRADFRSDNKPDNFGYMAERLVKIDYK